MTDHAGIEITYAWDYERRIEYRILEVKSASSLVNFFHGLQHKSQYPKDHRYE